MTQEPSLTLRHSLVNVRRFLLLLRPFWWHFSKSVLIGLGVSVVGLVIPYLTKLFVDEIYPAHNITLMHALVAALTTLTLTLSAATAVRAYYGSVIAAQASAAVTLVFTTHMQHKTPRFYDDHQVGEIMARFGELQKVVALTTGSLQQIILAGLYVLLIPPILLALHWQLAIVALLGFPVTLGVSIVTGNAQRWRWRQAAEAYAELGAAQVEFLTSIRTLRGLGAEEWCNRRSASLLESVVTRQVHAQGLSSAVTTINAFVGTVVTAVFTWYAWTLLLTQQLSLGAFIAFTAYLALFAGPSGQFAGMLSAAQQGAAQLDRVFEYLDAPVEQDPDHVYSRDARRCPRLRGQVELREISFGYASERRVLSNVSCTFEPASLSVIVGASGAGKSTLLRLLCRLEAVTEGMILVDGRPIHLYGLGEFRGQVAYVSQDIAVLQGTVADNLTLGREGISEPALWQALEICQLGDFVGRLPEGLATPLAEFGATLSTGQRQRLTIARAILRAGPILLLDEATSSLDLDTEAALLKALLASCHSRTIIMATHRLHTAARADQVLVLQDGRVKGCGPHAAVLASCDDYARHFVGGRQMEGAGARLRVVGEEG